MPSVCTYIVHIHKEVCLKLNQHTYFDLEICIDGTENSFKRTFIFDVLSKLKESAKCCEQSVVQFKLSCNF